MAWMMDLQPCNYFPVECNSLVAIGWLSSESTYEKGAVDLAFFEKLRDFSQNPWQPFASAGTHSCELCQFEAPAFSDNLFIPYQGAIYVAPSGITHYIAQHWYKPPSIFIEAVMACPEMRSMEYKKALLANGGRELVRLAKESSS